MEAPVDLIHPQVVTNRQVLELQLSTS